MSVVFSLIFPPVVRLCRCSDVNCIHWCSLTFCARITVYIFRKCSTSQCTINTLWAVWCKTRASRGFTRIVVLFRGFDTVKISLPHTADNHMLGRGFIRASILGTSGFVALKPVLQTQFYNLLQKDWNVVIQYQTECMNTVNKTEVDKVGLGDMEKNKCQDVFDPLVLSQNTYNIQNLTWYLVSFQYIAQPFGKAHCSVGNELYGWNNSRHTSDHLPLPTGQTGYCICLNQSCNVVAPLTRGLVFYLKLFLYSQWSIQYIEYSFTCSFRPNLLLFYF